MAFGYGRSYGRSYGLADPVRLLLASADMLPVDSKGAVTSPLPIGSTGLVDPDALGVGALSSGLPIPGLGASSPGVRNFSIVDDFYERFYIVPDQADFGVITRETTLQLKVWNAWLNSANVVSVILADLENDAIDVTTPSLPSIMTSLKTVNYPVTAQILGNTTVNGSLIFNFSTGQQIVVPVTGLRGRLWPFLPNWDSKFAQTFEYKTEILTSRAGREQRIAQRTTPRTTIEFSCVATGDDRKLLGRILDRYQHVDHIVPDIPRHTFLAADVASGALTLPLEEIPEWLIEGTIVVLAANGNVAMNRVITVDSLANTIGLSDATTSDWGEGTYVCYGMLGTLESSTGTRRLTNDTTEVSVKLSGKPGYEPYIAPPAASRTLNGREVFLVKPDWSSTPQVTHTWPVEFVDYGRGTTQKFTPIMFGSRVEQWSYVNMSFDEAEEIVNCFKRMRGRRGEFYAPTWEEDITAADTLVIGTNTIRAAGLELYQDYAESTVFKAILIRLKDGTNLVRKITGMSQLSDGLGDDTRITVSGTWPRDIFTDEILMICWMPVHRFASDSLTVEWLADDKSRTQISVQTIEDLTPEV